MGKAVGTAVGGGRAGGQHFGMPPSLVPSPGETRSPCQIFHLNIVDFIKSLHWPPPPLKNNHYISIFQKLL